MYMVEMAVCTKVFQNIFVLLTWERAKSNFVCILSLVTVMVSIYACIWWMHFKYILNKSRIEPGERISWKSVMKYERNTWKFQWLFFSLHYIVPCALFSFSSSYLQRILFLSQFRRKNINVFMYSCKKKCLCN